MPLVKVTLLLLILSTNANGIDLEHLANPIAQLQAMAKQPALQQSAQRHSQANLSIQDMLKIDGRWRQDPDLVNSVLDVNVQELFKANLNQAKPVFVELILMGKQGQTLAGVPLTSDYWQGDEAKFIQTLKRENVYVSNIDWDESTRTISAQISVPVWVDGAILGVLTGAVEANLETLSNTEIKSQ